MIRLTRLIPLLLVGAVLVGCTTNDDSLEAPASTAVSSPVPNAQKNVGEEPEKVATVDIATDWEDKRFEAQGAYSVAQVTAAAKTIEAYVENGFGNPDFLSGEWAQTPTGARLAQALEGQFTAARLDYIRSLDPKSVDPNVLSDVNSVVFLLYPKGEATAWQKPGSEATVKATGLTFTEEPTTKALKASLAVEITVPVQSESAQGTTTASYTLNTWLVDESGTMKIDGYANSWKISPFAS